MYSSPSKKTLLSTSNISKATRFLEFENAVNVN
jgi:hypothetical protein